MADNPILDLACAAPFLAPWSPGTEIRRGQGGLEYPKGVSVTASNATRTMTAKRNTQRRPAATEDALPEHGFSLPNLDSENHDAILRIWDELSDFEASQCDKAVRYLMDSLCQLVGATNVSWGGAIRMATGRRTDPLQGWRVAVMEELSPLTPDPQGEHFAELMRRWNEREIDPAFLRPLQSTGTFRTYSLRREMPQEWFASAFYRGFFESAGVYDSVFVGFPLNQDAESHFGFYFPRAISEEEISLLAYALRGIKWFHRWLMLGHGLLMASTALTPTERRVLRQLLTDATEKRIADQVGIAPATVHRHILSIFRKFGVGSRAGLMALWLNRPG